MSKPSLLTTNNNECLTPCIPKGKTFVHPVTVNTYKSMRDNVCAIEPILGEEDRTIWYEPCNLDDNETHDTPDSYSNFMLTYYFDPTSFLAQVYGINSFDEAVYWSVENIDKVPFNNMKRVQNSAWLAYGQKPNQVTETVINFYYDYIVDNVLGNYISSLKHTYSFDMTDSTLRETILAKYLNKDLISNVIRKFIKRDDWKSISDYFMIIINEVYTNIRNKIAAESIDTA